MGIRPLGCSLVLALLVPEATIAHPGDGLVVADDGSIYFVATDPVNDVSQHHATIWRWSEAKGAERTYRSRFSPSNLYIEKGRDGELYCAEVRNPGSRNGEDQYTTRIGRLHSHSDIEWLTEAHPGRRAFGGAAFLVDRHGRIIYPDAANRLVSRDKHGKESFLEVDAEFTDVRLLAWGPGDDVVVLDGEALRIIRSDGSVDDRVLRHSTDETRIKSGPGLDRTILFDLTADQDGNIYLADWGARRILRIDNDGKVTLHYVETTDYAPEGLAIHQGQLIVFQSLHPRADAGILPRLIALNEQGHATPLYEYSR